MPQTTTHSLTWNGRGLTITHEPDWLPGFRDHLEIRSDDGDPLPITETGYRSHFLPSAELAHAGGPVAFVRAWLDRAATSPSRQRAEEARKQFALFPPGSEPGPLGPSHRAGRRRRSSPARKRRRAVDPMDPARPIDPSFAIRELFRRARRSSLSAS